MTILAPIEGDPDEVLRLAGDLDAAGEHLASSARVLASLDVHASWASPAGDAFARRIDGCPGVMTMAARRYAAAAAALRTFAGELRACQSEATRASRAHEVARLNDERIQGLIDALPDTGVGVEVPARAALRAKQIDEQAAVAQAARQHTSAWADYRRADRRCARALAECSHDTLTDSLPYRFLQGRIRLDERVASAASWVGRAGARQAALATLGAEADAATSRLMLAWFYDEGSATEALRGPATTVLLDGAGLLRMAGMAGGLLAKQAGPVRYLSPRQRAVEGWRDYVAKASWNPHRPKPANPPAVRPHPSGVPVAGVVRPVGVSAATTRAKAAVRQSAPVQEVRGYLDDWAIATRNGRGSQALMAASLGIRVADSATGKAAKAQRYADTARAFGVAPEFRPGPGTPPTEPSQPPAQQGPQAPRTGPGSAAPQRDTGRAATRGARGQGAGEQEPTCERPVLRGIPGLPSAPPTYP